MKSLAVIKSIIPVMAGVQAAGTFSNSLVAAATGWTDTLVTAACEDRIDLSDAVVVFDALIAAETFQAQQDEIATGLEVMHRLLDDIPAGKMPVWTPPPDNYQVVRRRLTSSIEEVISQYRPSTSKMAEIRKDASTFAGLVKGETYDGTLSAECDRNAETAFNYIDNAIDADFGARQKMLGKAAELVRKVA